MKLRFKLFKNIQIFEKVFNEDLGQEINTWIRDEHYIEWMTHKEDLESILDDLGLTYRYYSSNPTRCGYFRLLRPKKSQIDSLKSRLPQKLHRFIQDKCILDRSTFQNSEVDMTFTI